MKNPYSNEPMQIIEGGSLADYLQNGGEEKDIVEHARKSSIYLYNMPLKSHRRIVFKWMSNDESKTIYNISVFVIRVSANMDIDDFRFCYSTEGIHEQLVLRGWNP